MIEHRLIEKVFSLTGERLKTVRETKTINPVYVETAVDFVRTYADRTHHGKEEDILFNELEKKSLSAQDRELMDELVHEHVLARKKVGELVEANNSYKRGDASSLGVIVDSLGFLIELYPKHIYKEDEIFFPNTEKYFSDRELDRMLEDFHDFDQKMIHEKYNKVYNLLKEL